MIYSTKNLSWFVDYMEVKSGSYYIPSSFESIDNVIDGFYPGTLVVVGARPNIGKTTLLLNFLERLSRNNMCLFFSTETSKEKIIERLASLRLKIPHKELRVNTAQYIEKIKEKLGELESSNLYIVDDSAPSLEDVEKAIKSSNARIVLFDYFQNVSLPFKRGWQSNAGEYARIVEGFARLARENNLTFILASQLKRFSEDREKPILSDLKETGKLEEAAHVVMLLSQNGGLTVDIAKNKEGMKGEVLLKGEWEYGLLHD